MYSTGIDVFTVDWHGVNSLFVPPILIACKFQGITNITTSLLSEI
jgi:hypothetical protein